MAGLIELIISLAIYGLIALFFYITSLKISPRQRKDELYACGEIHPEEKMSFVDLLKAVYKTLKRGLKL